MSKHWTSGLYFHPTGDTMKGQTYIRNTRNVKLQIMVHNKYLFMQGKVMSQSENRFGKSSEKQTCLTSLETAQT